MYIFDMYLIGRDTRQAKTNYLKKNKPCKSTCGFQSESNKITVSAVCKLIPRPFVVCIKKKEDFIYM